MVGLHIQAKKSVQVTAATPVVIGNELSKRIVASF
jgi:hypothetical protein